MISMADKRYEWTQQFDKHAAPEAIAAAIRYWKKQRSHADQQLDILLRLHGRRTVEREQGIWPGKKDES